MKKPSTPIQKVIAWVIKYIAAPRNPIPYTAWPVFTAFGIFGFFPTFIEASYANEIAALLMAVSIGDDSLHCGRKGLIFMMLLLIMRVNDHGHQLSIGRMLILEKSK